MNGKVIIHSVLRLRVGEIEHGLSDDNRKYHPNQPFLVLREATKDEYITDCDGEEQELSVPASDHFYEISTD